MNYALKLTSIILGLCTLALQPARSFAQYDFGECPDGEFCAYVDTTADPLPADTFATIGEAIEEAELLGYSLLLVAPGVYNENIDINVPLEIRAVEGPLNTCLDGSARLTGDDTVIVTSTNAGAAVVGFNIRGGRFGVNIQNNTTAMVSNCIVEGNDLDGVITNWTNGQLPVSEAMIYNNVIYNNGRAGFAGYMTDFDFYDIDPAIVSMHNNIIIANETYGVATYLRSQGNTRTEGSRNTERFQLTHNIIVGNRLGTWSEGILEGRLPQGPGNQVVAPKFLDSGEGFGADVRLASDSPAIDSGWDASQFNDPDGTRNDIGAFGGPRAEGFFLDARLAAASPQLATVRQDAITTGPLTFLTIAEALEASVLKGFDEIEVFPGSYVENLSIYTPNTLRALDGPLVTCLDGASRANSTVFVSGSVQGVEIIGFTIKNGTYGVYMNDNTSTRISNCIIEGNESDGVYSDWSNRFSPVTEATVTNNVIYANGRSGFASLMADFDFYDYDPSFVSLHNNIIIANETYGVGIYIRDNQTRAEGSANTERFQMSHNIITGNLSGTWSEVIREGRLPVGAENTSVSPRFLNEGAPCGSDFRLAANSPAINAGRSLGSDLDPDGTTNDIGAFGGSDAKGFYINPALGFPNPALATVRNDGGTTGPITFTTIQDAIDASLLIGFEKIEVLDGVYDENLIIRAPVKLYSTGGPLNTCIDGSIRQKEVSTIVITSGAQDVEIVGFNLRGGLWGVYQDNNTSALISNCVIEGNDREGIYTAWNNGALPITNTRINNNVVYNNGRAGIGAFMSDADFYDHNPQFLSIHNNIIVGNSTFGFAAYVRSESATRSDGSVNSERFQMSHNLFSNNGAGRWSEALIEGRLPISDGNLTDSPHFINSGEYCGTDVRLADSSPAVDSGWEVSQFEDSDGSVNDMGAFGGPLASDFFEPAIINPDIPENFTVRQDGETGPGTFLTIGDAIAAAALNGVEDVLIYPGRYQENLVITYPISLRSIDGPLLTCIDGALREGGDHTILVTDEVLDVEIVGLTIKGGDMGVFIDDRCSALVSNCVLEGNSREGVYVDYSSGGSPITNARIHNNVFFNNGRAGFALRGRDFDFYDIDPAFISMHNNILLANSTFGVAIYIRSDGDVRADGSANQERFQLTHNIFSGNPSGTWSEAILEGRLPEGPNNVSAAPAFTSSAAGCGTDVRLRSNSPAIDTGWEVSQFRDPDGTRNDIGAYGGPNAAGYFRSPDDGPAIQRIFAPASVRKGEIITIEATGAIR